MERDAQAAWSGAQWWVERSTAALELLAVAIIVFTILIATTTYAILIARRLADATTYRDYRHQVGRALLLGLEILVAADIIRTVALEPNLKNVAILGLLVLIRTFLSWGLVVEIEGRWPWQSQPVAEGGARRVEHNPSL